MCKTTDRAVMDIQHEFQVLALQRRLVKWWRQTGTESEFPWRKRETPRYHSLVVEVLLARTRAESVRDVYPKFFRTFPNPEALAGACDVVIQELLKPLGLIKRVEQLKRLGQAIVNGIPGDVGALSKLPGVGLYAANAFCSLHLGKRASVPDANSARLFGRIFGIDFSTTPRRRKSFYEFCHSVTPKRRFREFNYAVLDFGRKICRPRNPVCSSCPLKDICLHNGL
jgi:A/G-specific adenine glycosylase